MKFTEQQKEALKWIRYHGLLCRYRNCLCGRKMRNQKLNEAWEKICFYSEIASPGDRGIIHQYLKKIWTKKN